MSEYQYYEFLALDRPLTEREQAEVRALSTRAQISATRFTNEYHWGDFGGDPLRMVERYYDAHLHFANWGSRTLMFRLSLAVFDVETVDPYLVDSLVTVWDTDEHMILGLHSEDEGADFFARLAAADEDTVRDVIHAFNERGWPRWTLSGREVVPA
ncbi:hypothetical protein Ae406Ps2_6073c [Pseudonocardia sp. Ae406_Ps2]|uniref:hypothetical protein n=1 Tax=unclassified Pseudonocardia TaxID=2619320 RepID=UPI00094B1B8F|nr:MULTISPECIES: hypothetical protein [unclassified Pseudonocardia]OLL89761.1 hypothetical protein Ae331Ps2_6096 [Pseudonocardia sp. Ae331_Ps2]OLL96237.1 hypothetical protein Ae406Ps2_6073c [Pseudonocardia sp. Ae406_Ps2]OLM09718.1 hypothetical protein Ae706Ps2_6180 [Pseudonocardia sp. Ae706_Ps2]